jgi:DNA-binding NtrC family response regulator
MDFPVTKNFSCLLVDDDVGFAGMLAKIVAQEGGEPVLCHTIAAGRAQIARRPFDLVILDNGLPDGTGFEFYPQVTRRHPASVVVMITGAPELSQAVELTRNGLFDYLTKPLDADDFRALLRRARLRLQPPAAEGSPDALLGASAVMSDTVSQLEQAARHTAATVLLVGETGTGKEVAARLLHRLTFADRAAKAPFVALNCPNVPAEMFEAELFGSEKGAYTGADRRRTGLVEAAEGGTLFLDEIGEIPLALQPKLLRFLESREYRGLGATGSGRFAKISCIGSMCSASAYRLSANTRRTLTRSPMLCWSSSVKNTGAPGRSCARRTWPPSAIMLSRATCGNCAT